jgi:hypothetical protein
VIADHRVSFLPAPSSIVTACVICNVGFGLLRIFEKVFEVMNELFGDYTRFELRPRSQWRNAPAICNGKPPETQYATCPGARAKRREVALRRPGFEPGRLSAWLSQRLSQDQVKYHVKNSVLNAKGLEALKVVFLADLHNRNEAKCSQAEIRVV